MNVSDSDLQKLQPVGATIPGPKVFVYGTLKQGHPNHYLLQNAGSEPAEFLGRCFLTGPYRMCRLGGYPGVSLLDSTKTAITKIFGEVYKVNEEILDSLDLLEGNGKYFTRSKVVTPWKNAWMYFLPEAYTKVYPQIDAGQWQPLDAELKYWQGN